MCGGAQGSQIFKQNRIILIHSRVIASLVICCPRGRASSPCHPRIIPVVSQAVQVETMWSPLSPSSQHHPRIIPVVPCGLCCLPRLSYPISTSTTPGDMCASYPLSPRHLHIACVAPRWSPHMQCCPHHPQSLQIC